MKTLYFKIISIGLYLICFTQATAQMYLYNINPAKAKPGDVVTVSGYPANYFDKVNIQNNIVYFAGSKANVIAFNNSGNDNLIVRVPEGAMPGPVSVVNLSSSITGMGVTPNSFLPTFAISTGESNLSKNNFRGVSSFNVDLSVIDFELGDFNLDGKTDIVVGKDFGAGQGTYFNILQNISSPANVNLVASKINLNLSKDHSVQRIEIADLDRDGKLDVGVHTRSYDSVSSESHLSLLKNTSSGGSFSFGAPINNMTTPYTFDFHFGAVDYDGSPDILFNDIYSLYLHKSFIPDKNLTMNNLTLSGGAYLGGSYIYDVLINKNYLHANITNPGYKYGYLSNDIFYNGGSSFSQINYSYQSSLTDVNNDGIEDLIVAGGDFNYYGTIFIYTSTGAGYNFAGSFALPSGIDIKSMAIGDLNGDQKPDLAVSADNSDENFVLVYINDRSNIAPYFSSQSIKINIPTSFSKVKIADMDGDDRPDIIGGGVDGKMYILRNQAFFNPLSISITSSGKIIPTDKGTLQLNATVLPANASDKSIAWTTYPPLKAYVDPNGLVTAMENGVVTITASSILLPDVNSSIILTITGQSGFNPPVVTDFTPRQMVPGHTFMSVYGSNFDPNPVNNIVYFGSVKAHVKTASSTELLINTPEGGIYGSISVSNPKRALTGYSSQLLNPTFFGTVSLSGSNFKKTSSNLDYLLEFLNVGDMNLDGKPDLSLLGNKSVMVLKNNTFKNIIDSNSFQIAYQDFLSLNSNKLSCDVNSDGKLDLVGFYQSYSGQTQSYTNYIAILLNTSTGSNISFAAPQSFLIESLSSFYAMQACDMDKDGRPEIVVLGNDVDGTIGIYSLHNISDPSRVNFEPAKRLSSSPDNGTYGKLMSIADLDLDGYPDIIHNNTDTTLRFLKNNSTKGNIALNDKNAIIVKAGFKIQSIGIADLNGDDFPEICVGNSNEFRIRAGKNQLRLEAPSSKEYISVLMNTTKKGALDINSFAYPVFVPSVVSPGLIEFADLDGDKMVDIVAAQTNDSLITVLKNKIKTNQASIDTNAFINAGILISTGLITSLKTGDLDADNKPEIIVLNRERSKVQEGGSTGYLDIFKNNSPSIDLPSDTAKFIVISIAGSGDMLTPQQPTITFSGIIFPEFITNRKVIWSVIPNNGIVTISGEGVAGITSDKSGVFTIVGTSDNNPSVVGYYVLIAAGKTIVPNVPIQERPAGGVSSNTKNPCSATLELYVPQLYNTYQWFIDGFKIVGADSNTYKPVVDGNYSVIAIDSAINKFSAHPVTVSGIQKPIIQEVGNPFSSLIASTVSGAVKYQWYVNERVIKGASGNKLDIFYNGSYFVTVFTIDSCKTRSDIKNVSRDGFTDVLRSGLRITDSTIENYGALPDNSVLKIHPNPANEQFIVSYLPGNASEFPVNCTVINYQGKIVTERSLELQNDGSFASKILTNTLAKGIYFIKITQADRIKCQKITIQ